MTKMQMENHMILLGVDKSQWPTKRQDLIIADPYNHASYLRFSKTGKDSYTVTVETVPQF